MNIGKYTVAFASLVLVQVSAPAFGKQVRPNDFASSLGIQLQPGQPLYEFELTEPVYINSQRPDLADVRIYSSDDKLVPFIRQSSQGDVKARSNLAPFPARIFPLYVDKGKSLNDLQVHVSTSAQGSIVDVKVGNGDKTKNKTHKIGYLVDTSHIQQPIYEFKLAWQPAVRDAQLIQLQVEYSNDLVAWHRINIDNVVAKMFYQGYRLDRSTIRVGNREAKYFRLSWPGTAAGINIYSIQALGYIDSRVKPEYRWTTIKGAPDPDQANTFIYDTGGYLPARRAQIVLPKDFSSATATLESTNRLTAEPERQLSRRHLPEVIDPGRILSGRHSRGHGPDWQLRSYNKPVYDIEINGIRITSEDLYFSKTSDRYWRVRFSANTPSISEAPQLRLGWLPDKVTFLATGKPPYRLVVGNEKINTGGTADSLLIRQMRDKKLQTGQATLGPVTVLADRKRDHGGKFSGDKVLNWILWVVMIAGVLMLVWMTQRLVRQLPGHNDDD